eukprot:TRINITY_DN1703_c0_g1_i1.p1 TRINITY_DN1703_c0_g1~~TRINITY_DN1703_c0_g1_i1.p1  ORF type:complete len:105 (-),score=0.98 TRINITY_DN1703_c0_g1_i1:161-475(-)
MHENGLWALADGICNDHLRGLWSAAVGILVGEVRSEAIPNSWWRLHALVHPSSKLESFGQLCPSWHVGSLLTGQGRIEPVDLVVGLRDLALPVLQGLVLLPIIV